MDRPFANKTMQKMVASHQGTTYPQPQGPANLSPQESARDWKIAANMRTKSFMGNIYTRFTLPHEPDDAHPARSNEFFRQSAMPWNNTFMSTPTDGKRLNNPAQTAFVKQRQLTIPSTYGQFYAFMHALAAAFGNLNTR